MTDGRVMSDGRGIYSCPTCGAQDEFPTGLPGGPALCEHPSSQYTFTAIAHEPSVVGVICGRMEEERGDAYGLGHVGWRNALDDMRAMLMDLDPADRDTFVGWLGETGA